MLIHRLIYIGRWRCDFYFDTGGSDFSSVMERLEEMEAPHDILWASWEKMAAGLPNGGFTYTNALLMSSCVFIGATTSGAEFLDSFTHELRHLADDIATYLGIDLRGERVAYLTGDTTRDLAEIVCRLGCPDCRHP